MKCPKLKITGFLTILVIFFFSSCEKDELEYNLYGTESDGFLYKTEKIYCEGNPEDVISLRTFKYDRKGNRIEMIAYSFDKPVFKIINTYNAQSLKLTESYYNFTNNTWVLGYNYQYKYAKNKLIEKINFNTEDSYKTVYTYSGGLLKYEEIFQSSGNEWLLSSGYLYKYNRFGRLIEKIKLINGTREPGNDKYIYIYKNDKLSTEKRILASENIFIQ